MSKLAFGTAGAIQWIHAGGTVSLLPNFTELEFNLTGENEDTTSGALTWDTHLPTRRNWEVTGKMFWDDGSTNGTADFSHLLPNELGVIAIGHLGTATGKPKLGGSASVTSFNTSMPFAAPMTAEFSLKGQGTPYWVAGSAW